MQITRDASWGVQVSTGYLLRVIHFDTDPVNVCLKINPVRPASWWNWPIFCKPPSETGSGGSPWCHHVQWNVPSLFSLFNEKSFARWWWMKLLPRTTVQIAVPDEFLSRHRDWIVSLKTRRWLNRNYFGRVTIFWPRRNIHRERLERNVYRQKGKIGEHLKLETRVWFACGAGNGKTSFSCWKTEGGRWKHSSKEIVLSRILTKLCESGIF